MADRTLTVRIAGDASGAMKAFGNLEKSAASFDKQMKGVGDRYQALGDKMARVGAKMSLAISAPLALGGAKAMDAASNLQQSVGAVESVFGDAGDAIFKFGETADQTAGLSKRAVNEMAARVGASLKGVGFSTTEAATKVIELEKRAADLAATFGGSTADAIDAIAALMRGERDPIERYGVAIKEADVAARVLALGLDTTTLAAEKEAKAIAGLDLLMEQSADAAGQFAREQGTAAGKAQQTTAELENMAATLGAKLLPLKIKVLDMTVKVAEAFGSMPAAAQTVVLAFAGVAFAAGPVITVMGGVIKAAGALKAAWAALSVSTWAMTGRTMGSLIASFGAVAIPIAVVTAGVYALNRAYQNSVAPAKAAGEAYARAFAEAAGQGATAKAAIEQKIRDLINEQYVTGATYESMASIDFFQRAIKEMDLAERGAADATKVLGGAMDGTKAKTDEFAEKLKTLSSTVFESADASRSYRDAQRGVTSANEGLARAQETLNDLLRTGAVDTKAVAAAEKDLERAHRGVADAQRAVIDAQNALAEARKPADADDLRSAELDVAAATRAMERADLRVLETKDKLAHILADGAISAADYRDAELDVIDAQENAERSGFGLRDAQQRLNELRQVGAPMTDAVKDAERRLDDATRGLRDAQDGARESQEKLDLARAGDPEFTDRVADARRGLRDAEYGVEAAQERAKDAAWKLHEAQEALNQAALNGVELQGALNDKLDGFAARFPQFKSQMDALRGVLPTGEAERFIAGMHLGVLPANAIPRFHSGGVMPGAPGSEGLAILKAGEHVGGGGISVGQIVIDGSRDPAATARAVREELLKLKRRTGDLGLN